MKWTDLVADLSILLASLILFVFGYFAIFRQYQLTEYYRRNMGIANARNSMFFEKMVKQKWFYINLKVCGVAMLFMALLFLLIFIHGLFGVTFGIFKN